MFHLKENGTMNKNPVKDSTNRLFADEGRRIILIVTIAFAVIAILVGTILQSILWIFAALMILGFGIILELVTLAAKKMTKLEGERKTRDEDTAL